MSKFNINDFRQSKEKQREGVWVELGDGASIKVAYSDNPDFQSEFTKLVKPYRMRGTEVPTDKMSDIICECLSKHVLLDWKGIYDGDKEISFSQEKAKALLSEIDFLRDRVVEESKRLENFKLEVISKTEKNSRTS